MNSLPRVIIEPYPDWELKLSPLDFESDMEPDVPLCQALLLVCPIFYLQIQQEV